MSASGTVNCKPTGFFFPEKVWVMRRMEELIRSKSVGVLTESL